MEYKNLLPVVFLLMGAVMAQGEPQPGQVTPIMQKNITGCEDKEILIITVDYEPGGADPAHRHYAQAMVYVLEGAIEMAVNGEAPVTVSAGETFYESRTDVHTIGRNASKDKKAKFLVVLAKDFGAGVVFPPY